MGTEIHLIAKGEDFSPELWERIYEESLVLLENFPARLMRFKVEKAGGRKRYCYSPDIVSNRYKPDEHWTVSGDMSSLQRAEAFDLYRHHSRQFPDEGSFSRPANSHDVLWRHPDGDLDSHFGNGRLLWDSKTQGRPYHFALLAVGMLVESRCSHGACVTGDIDREQAEQVASWANGVLEEPIDLPVCVDPGRLYRRVFELYSDHQLGMRRSSALFRGAQEELWVAIVSHAGVSTLRGWFAECLDSFESLHILGAVDHVIRYLESTGDVHGLIEVVQGLASRGDRERDAFSLEILLERLCSHFITIPPAERQVVPAEGAASPPENTSEESVWEILLTLARSGMAPKAYVPANELLEHFCEAEPHLRERFADIIRKSEQSCREKLQGVAETLDGRVSNGEPADSGDDSTPDSSPTGEDFLLKEIADQTPRYPEEERLARTTGEALRNRLLSSSVLAQITSGDALLPALYRVTRENEIVLTARSWETIDSLEDEEVLKHLLALAYVGERELHFCDWRRYLLEHPRLWNVLAGRVASESSSG